MPQKNSVEKRKTHSNKVEGGDAKMNNNKEQLNEKEKSIREITEVEIRIPNMKEIKFPFNIQKVWEKFESKLEKAVKESKKIRYWKNVMVESLMNGAKEEIESSLERIYYLKKREVDIKMCQEYNIKQPLNELEKKEFRELAKKQIREILGENIEENIADLLTMEWLRFLEIAFSQRQDYMKLIKEKGEI